MRKKKVFALAMAGCMMFTQPVFAEELQKELTDAVVISDDAQKEGNLDVLSEDGERTVRHLKLRKRKGQTLQKELRKKGKQEIRSCLTGMPSHIWKGIGKFRVRNKEEFIF